MQGFVLSMQNQRHKRQQIKQRFIIKSHSNLSITQLTSRRESNVVCHYVQGVKYANITEVLSKLLGRGSIHSGDAMREMINMTIIVNVKVVNKKECGTKNEIKLKGIKSLLLV